MPRVTKAGLVGLLRSVHAKLPLDAERVAEIIVRASSKPRGAPKKSRSAKAERTAMVTERTRQRDRAQERRTEIVEAVSRRLDERRRDKK